MILRSLMKMTHWCLRTPDQVCIRRRPWCKVDLSMDRNSDMSPDSSCRSAHCWREKHCIKHWKHCSVRTCFKRPWLWGLSWKGHKSRFCLKKSFKMIKKNSWDRNYKYSLKFQYNFQRKLHLQFWKQNKNNNVSTSKKSYSLYGLLIASSDRVTSLVLICCFCIYAE